MNGFDHTIEDSQPSFSSSESMRFLAATTRMAMLQATKIAIQEPSYGCLHRA